MNFIHPALVGVGGAAWLDGYTPPPAA